ncbi:unnamed protein product, partial [Adineta ricciae]
NMENFPFLFLSTMVNLYLPYYGLHPMTKFIPVVHYVFIREGLKVIYKNEVSEFIPWEWEIFHDGLIVIDYVKENHEITCEFRFEPTILHFLFTHGPKGFSGVFKQDCFMKNNHELLSGKVDELIQFIENSLKKVYRPRLLWHGRFQPESSGKEPAGTCWNREELYRNRLRFQRIQSPE